MDIKLAAQLKDIHLPAEPGIWPLAPGWWGVSLLVILLFASLFFLVKRYRRGAARREALAQLQKIESEYLLDKDSGRYFSDISKLLRRAAIHAFSREACAGLSGEAWLQFLQSHSANGGFIDGVGSDLIEVQFKPQTSNLKPQSLKPQSTGPDTVAINQLTEQWLRGNL